MKTILIIGIFLLGAGCAKNDASELSGPTDQRSQTQTSDFYSKRGQERLITFEAEFLSAYTRLDQIAKLTEKQKSRIATSEIKPVVEYFFGPLTHREIGGKQRKQTITVRWEKAFLKNKKIVLPYTVDGVWILEESQTAKKVLILPLPYNENIVLTAEWKSCTDSDPDHQTASFYWYFWDPSRYGCDQKLGIHYQNIYLKIGEETVKTVKTYPEYDRLLRKTADGNQAMQMTFAFGYVEDPEMAKPYEDADYGMYEFRQFHDQVRSILRGNQFVSTVKEEPILESEYLEGRYPSNQIGTRFLAVKNGVKVIINVVAAANIDQMELFAKSYAHDNDGFFGWFGHSRVGSGFDAENFVVITSMSPNYYKLSNDYQIIYWAGCNSYSYYTLPFFDLKGGTKNLDIVSNGLPSLFSFNADNAAISLNQILNWDKKLSYQNWVDELELHAQNYGSLVLVNVLGDEDNPN